MFLLFAYDLASIWNKNIFLVVSRNTPWDCFMCRFSSLESKIVSTWMFVAFVLLQMYIHFEKTKQVI